MIGAGSGRAERSLGGLAVAYSPEYLRFRADPIALEDIARTTGGRVLRGDETSREVFPAERERKWNARPVIDWFLLVLACLVPLDVAFRRLQIEPRTWFRREAASTQTLGSLLERKAQFGTRDRKPAVRPSEPLVEGRASSPETTPGRAPPPSSPSSTSSAGEDDTQTTTERLLAMKRQRQRERGADDESR